MRIISGKFKGKRIQAPSSLPVRPTTDFAKEGLFNILANRIDFEDVRFLDLFAGTGNISWEMASRGCNDITCVDENTGCFNFIKNTAKTLKLSNLRVYRDDVYSFCNKITEQFNIIFADPPFTDKDIGTLPALVLENQLLHDEGWFIIEHSSEISFEGHPNFYEVRKYGKIRFSFFTSNGAEKSNT